MKVTNRSSCKRNSSSKRDVLPRSDDDVLGLEGLGPDHRLPDVRLGPLPHLHTELVRAGIQISLQSNMQNCLKVANNVEKSPRPDFKFWISDRSEI